MTEIKDKRASIDFFSAGVVGCHGLDYRNTGCGHFKRDGEQLIYVYSLANIFRPFASIRFRFVFRFVYLRICFMNLSFQFMRHGWLSAAKLSWLLTLLLITSGTSVSNAAIIPFVIAGAGGEGLRSTNERTNAGAAATIFGTPGSGGATGAGIFYDDGGAVGATKTLTLNFSWTGKEQRCQESLISEVVGHLCFRQ